MPKMYIKRLFPIAFLISILTSSCTPAYDISGSSSISRLDGRMLYIKCLKDGAWVKLDSAEIIHGDFFMKGNIDSIVMATLYMGDEAIMPLVLEDGKISITITDNLLHAQGTPLNDALYDFLDKRSEIEMRIDELERKEVLMVMNGEDIDNIHKALNEESDILVTEMNQFIKSFISANYENVLGPNVFMMFCSTLPYPLLTPQIEEIIDNAPYSFKMNKMVKTFISEAKENMQLIEEHQRLQQVDLAFEN